VKTTTINQGQLTEECWAVQMWGLGQCRTCEFLNKKTCGGKNIRETGKNSKGFSVPLGKKEDK
jgi:hypothetical protein